MNRTALITIKTSKDGKRCLNSCPGLDAFGDHCIMFDMTLDSVVVGDRFDAVRCRMCIAATKRFDKLIKDNLEELREAVYNA